MKSAEITDSVNLTGVIFRDETVLYGSRLGSVDQLYENGERAAKDSAVAEIYEGSYASDAELAFIDKQISLLTESNGAADNSTKATDAGINRLYHGITEKASDGDYGNITPMLDELLVLMNRREIIVNKRVDFNTEIAAWQIRRSGVITQGKTVAETVYTPYAGYFYRDVDGYETTLTVKALKGASYSDLKALLSAPSKYLASGENGYAVGKIARSPVWYVCAETDKKTALRLETGRDYRVSFALSSGKEVNFTLEAILTSPDSDGAVIVLSTSDVPRDLNYARKQSVSLFISDLRGLYVPSGAVHVDAEGRTGVYILKENLMTFRYIEIIDSAEGYYIVKEAVPGDEDYAKSLHKHDIIIVSGKELAEQIDLPEEESTEYRIKIFD